MKERLLSLSEMAAKLNRTAKTFRRHVDADFIPHVRVGKRLLFDEEEVVAYLKTQTDQRREKRIAMKPKRAISKGKFAEALGL